MNSGWIILMIILVVLVAVLIFLVFRSTSALRDLGRENEDLGRRISDLNLTVTKELTQNEIKTEKVFLDNFLRFNEITDRKFSEIRESMNQKIDSSLNERLDENFRQVSDRLESLYQSLGELKNLESGVLSLNKTLSNVKSRGVFGEMQLENILANILDRSQYEKNVATKPRSADFVEYAVKIPDKESGGSFIYLPIDAKFPLDIYNKIVDASAAADPAGVENGRKELKARIKLEAASIRDKYIAPPYTTDFAVMFIPTESMYAEILKIDGLAEDCQVRCKVIITGPVTLSALLNSLSVGFKYLTVNKKTGEILKTLGAFKTQFEKYDELISQTQKNLEAARNRTDKVKQRNEMIRRSLRNIDALDYSEASALIEKGISDDLLSDTDYTEDD